MRKGFYAIILLGFMLLPNVIAANSQGLNWSVQEGQKIHYTLSVFVDVESIFTITTLEETYQVAYTIQSLPSIPDTIELLSQLQYPTGIFSLENGSSIPTIPVTVPIVSVILPIGNWSLIDSLFRDAATFSSSTNITWIDDSTYWGFSYITDEVINAELTVSFQFSKSDGIASEISAVYDYGAEGEASVTFSRVGFILDTVVLLLIGGGIAAVIIIPLIIRRKFLPQSN